MPAQALRSYAEAAEKVRSELRHILYKAFKDAVAFLDVGDIKDFFKSLVDSIKKPAKGLLAAVLLNIDTDAVNRAVDTYETALRAQIQMVKDLIAPLEEASRAVPTFQAEGPGPRRSVRARSSSSTGRSFRSTSSRGTRTTGWSPTPSTSHRRSGRPTPTRRPRTTR
ncbi:hypothetical protein [Streptomyces sp. NPDC004284]|uniref:hypothetical protein n=1 Tax=Streptomyces sp. NPDC004284 TaxID=3364695 RepID=UPI003676B1A2